MKLSNKVLAMEHSPIRKFNAIAQKANEAGKKVYYLNIGQPDVETPACFMEAIRAFDEKVIAYAESGGVAALQDAISGYFRQYGMEYERENIIVTNGGSEALSMTFISLLNPGDEVLIPEPFYTNYHTFYYANICSIFRIISFRRKTWHINHYCVYLTWGNWNSCICTIYFWPWCITW